MAKNIFGLIIPLMIVLLGFIIVGCSEPCTVNCEHFLNSEKSCYRTKCTVEKAKDNNKYGVVCDCD